VLSGTYRVVPLSSARPVPASWPHPEPLEVARRHRRQGLRLTQSTNWSGYVDSGGGAQFTEASGSWTVPQVSPGPAGYSSSWVGIDGTTSQDLIQAGTEQDWGPQGVVYYAWYELLPAASMYLGPVYPGDQMSVDISKVGPASWTIAVYDLTQRTVWTGAVSYVAPGSSAEWVEEAPTNSENSQLYPLANFGAVNFRSLGVEGPATARATVAPVYMVTLTSGKVEAYPQRYSQATDSFDVSFGTPPSGSVVDWPAVPLGRGQPLPTVPGRVSTSPGSSRGGSSSGGSPSAGSSSGGSPSAGSSSGGSPSAGSSSGGSPGSSSGGSPSAGSSSGGSPGNSGVAEHPGHPGGSSVSARGGAMAVGQPPKPGYWLAAGDGGVFAFGSAPYGGSAAAVFAGAQTPGVSGIAAAQTGGYWLVTASGGVFPFGGAPYLGSVPALNLSAGVTPAIASSPSGDGYYILSPWGDVFAFGDARFEGSCRPALCGDAGRAGGPKAVALVPDANGKGYWVLLSDCRAVAFGNARPLASSACEDQARVSAVSAAGRSPDGRGFWALLADGALFPFGSAGTYGGWYRSGRTSAEGAVAVLPASGGKGAWVVSSDGSVEALGDAPALGGLPANMPLNQAVVSAAGA